MTLRNNIIFAIALFSLTIISCDRNEQSKVDKTFWADSSYLSSEEKLQRKVWVDFTNAINSMDTNTFKQLSMTCIYCPDCYSYLPKLQVDTSYGNDYTLIDEFVKNGGFESVFNEKAKMFYFNYANVGWIKVSEDIDLNLSNCKGLFKIKSKKIIEVSINDKNCSGDECSQTIFTFVDTDKGYKFYGMAHIP